MITKLTTSVRKAPEILINGHWSQLKLSQLKGNCIFEKKRDTHTS